MKKLLLSALLVASAMGVSAQRWDFTSWSAATVANLKAVNPSNTEWSDIEKAADSAPTDISKENCFWQVKASGADGITLSANSEPIKETEGLIFTNTSARSLAIAVNYPTTSLGTYNGPSYLWLGSKNQNYIVIPNVKPGTEITIGLESHKPSDARGIDLFIGRGNSGTKLLAPDGSTNPYPTTYVEQTWLVPEDATDTPNEDGTFDITIRNSNGCHLYFIDAGGEEQGEKKLNVAYLYESNYNGYCGIENDPVYTTTDLLNKYGALAVDVKDFNAESVDTLEALAANYDLLVISEAINGKSTFGIKLGEYVNRVPMLSLKAFFYNSGRWNWGTGKNPSTTKNSEEGVPFLDIVPEFEDHPIFANVYPEDGSIMCFYDYEGLTKNLVQGYEASAGSLIENDNVLATVTGPAGTFNAIHEHGAKNTYMLIPLSSDAMFIEGETNLSEDAVVMLNDAMTYLADTKARVTPCAMPTVSYEYAHMVTTVTLATTTPGANVYYTLDGSEPTEASTVYTAPFELTTGCKLAAIALCQGYDASAILKDSVVVKAKSATPIVEVTDGENGTKVVTMSVSDGSPIYYNLRAFDPTAASAVYTEPIVISRSTRVAAIAIGENKIESEVVNVDVEIGAYPFREKSLARVTFEDFVHTYTVVAEDGTETEKSITFKDKTYMWGQKKAWSYYYANGDSTEVNQDVKIGDFGNGWVAQSTGQVMHMHNDGSNTVGAGYGPATSADADFVKGGIQFLGKVSGDPYSACLYTNGANKFKGVFDIAVWMCGATTNVDVEPTGNELLEISTSTDGATWKVLDTLSIPNQKAVRRVVAHYDANEEVYLKFAHAGGNKLMLQQIEILAEGLPDAIESVATESELVAKTYYTLSGMMVKNPTQGVVIVKKIYADGTMKVEKQLIK